MEDVLTYPSFVIFLKMGWVDEALRKVLEMDDGPRKISSIEKVIEEFVQMGFCQDAANAAEHLPKEVKKKYKWLEETCLVQ